MSESPAITRLKKLLTLAQRGVGGEAENARVALEAALRKHGLTIDDLDDGVKRRRSFSYRGAWERSLIHQIIATVCGVDTQFFVPVNRSSRLYVDATQEQIIQIELLWEAHRASFKKEVDLLLSAYIHRQHLFPSDAPKADETNMTPEELENIERMAMMMQGIKRVSIRRQLREGGGK